MRIRDKLSRSRLYRSRNGAIFGVCRGVAEHFDFSVFGARAIAVIFLFVSGFWPAIGLYLIAALLMKPAPVIPLQTEDEQEFYNSYTASGGMAIRRLKRTYENLNRRIQRLEDLVTTREYDWERRLNERT